MNKKVNLFKILFITIGLLLLALIYMYSSFTWEYRTVCSDQNTFVSCSQSDIDGSTIGHILLTGSVLISIYTAIYLIYSFASNSYRKDIKQNSESYKKLENVVGWRFSKVAFWIILSFSSFILLISQDSHGDYPFFVWGLSLLFLSYPLFIVFRRLALYVVTGKKS